GNFVKATLATTAEAAAGAGRQMPADFRISITDAPGANAYPVSSFTWLLFSESPPDKMKAKAMVDFMRWALTDGQKLAPDLWYAPLPADVIRLELTALARIRLQ